MEIDFAYEKMSTKIRLTLKKRPEVIQKWPIAFIALFNFKIVMHFDTGFLGTIKPDQMQALNPLFIIILIPLFEAVVYPLLKRPKPLKRMCTGMFLASVAFVFAGFLQMKIQVKPCNIQQQLFGSFKLK